jgi:tetratricopeptide (TPR) repeat protein
VSDSVEADPTPAAPAPPAAGLNEWIDRLNTWQRLGLGGASLITALAAFANAADQHYVLIAATVVLVLIAGALYIVSHRGDPAKREYARWLRVGAVWLLVAIPLGSAVVLFWYSVLPRIHEQGTTVAILRFVGPPLPKPYDACRPSDALLTTLTGVGNRFGRLTAFELDASLDPDNRFAPQWAQAHGALEGADITIYGAYTLLRGSNANPLSTDPDQMVMHVQVADVPSIPHTTTHAQLYAWDIPSSAAESIAAICGGPPQSGANLPPFLDNGRRLALAIVGLQLFGLQHFEEAQQALSEARQFKKGDARACEGATETSCPGVLAFYLGTLDQRFGNYVQAEAEYRYAAAQIPAAASYIDLGELYMEAGRPNEAFVQFDKAVSAEPQSVAALATRAYYERDYLRPWQSALDLDRAIRARGGFWQNVAAGLFGGTERRSATFDDVVLSRAQYDRGDTTCGLRMLYDVIHGAGFNTGSNVDALVRYGTWLVAAKRYDDAIATLTDVVEHFDAQHPVANYELGLALQRGGRPRPEAAAYFRRAVFAPAHSDGEFLVRGDAANELRASYDDAGEAVSDEQTAIAAYGRSIELNPKAAYAYHNRGVLYVALKRDAQADLDLRTAASLHPYDEYLVSEYAHYLDKHGRTAAGKLYHDQVAYVQTARIPAAEAASWDKDACRYSGLDIGS